MRASRIGTELAMCIAAFSYLYKDIHLWRYGFTRLVNEIATPMFKQYMLTKNFHCCCKPYCG